MKTEQISEGERQIVKSWLERGQQRGRPSCPCGVVSNSHHIRRHREGCQMWRAYCQLVRESDGAKGDGKGEFLKNPILKGSSS
jgi:ferredoxin-thioredoxin reductase catalytic subunit